MKEGEEEAWEEEEVEGEEGRSWRWATSLCSQGIK